MHILLYDSICVYTLLFKVLCTKDLLYFLFSEALKILDQAVMHVPNLKFLNCLAVVKT